MKHCPACLLPMVDGQALNGLLKCHWDCTDATRTLMGEENADDLIQARVNNRLAMDGITRGHRLFTQLGGM